MSLNQALSSATSALLAQSYALQNISSNIANSQTTAYKRTDTSFANLVNDVGANPINTAGVAAAGTATTGVQGTFMASSISTYMAIDSDGYFVVDTKTGNSSSDTFTGGDFYTRRGDFTMDKDGYFVNGAGYYLEGLALDPTTGQAVGSDPSVIQISNAALPPKATTTITYQGNLPTNPSNADTQAGGTGLYAGTALGNVAADDADTFIDQSVAGGTMTVYDSAGNSYDVEMRWAKVADADPNGLPPVEDTWNLFYLSNSAATGTDTEWTNAGTSYTFDATGKSTNAAASSVTLSNLSIDGTTVGTITLNHGTTGLTQYADNYGQASVTTASQDGYGSGQLDYVEVGDSGLVTAVYSNGQRVNVAQVVTATFNASDQLEALGGGTYAATADSGDAIIDASGASILSGMLESSNTDITEEFSKLIITQQAYSAATRIMTTADDMMKEVVNMAR